MMTISLAKRSKIVRDTKARAIQQTHVGSLRWEPTSTMLKFEWDNEKNSLQFDTNATKRNSQMPLP